MGLVTVIRQAYSFRALKIRTTNTNCDLLGEPAGILLTDISRNQGVSKIIV